MPLHYLRYIIFLGILCGAISAVAGVEIVDLPLRVETPYDCTWTVGCHAPATTPLTLSFEGDTQGNGYQLRLTNLRAGWYRLEHSRPICITHSPLALKPGQQYLFTIKRRPETIALLLNHRLLFTAPAPAVSSGSVHFQTHPKWAVITNARYRQVGPHSFGDDFMRAKGLEHFLLDNALWSEDDIWKVAFYRRDDPRQQPVDPRTHKPLANPWQLSLSPNAKTTANGFWMLYTGLGPSWTVANPSMVFPSWDHYYVQAAIKPTAYSTVGLLAAYQDNRNYLLFRWHAQRQGGKSTPGAELLAVREGKTIPLATSRQGFIPEQWYTLRINLGWHEVQALVDGQVLLSAHDPGLIEGRVGLYADQQLQRSSPAVDAATRAMYVEPALNAPAATATTGSSCIQFDDVRAGDWQAVDDVLTDPGYQRVSSGTWQVQRSFIRATTPGTILAGPSWERYTAQTMLRLPQHGRAGLLFQMDGSRNGYAWVLSTTGQQLYQVSEGKLGKVIAGTSYTLPPEQWTPLRVEVDGPYVALFCAESKVLEDYHPSRVGGKCGVLAQSPGVMFRALSIERFDPWGAILALHEGFARDNWLVTWASAEADWYPAFTPASYVTPLGVPHEKIGAAAPLPTDTPGLYWYKGGCYHRLRVTIPTSQVELTGQELHLATGYEAHSGYRLQLTAESGQGIAELWRGPRKIGRYAFHINARSQLVLERYGAFLVLSDEMLDPTENADESSVLSRNTLVMYRDAVPLAVDTLGFSVTSPSLPAVSLRIETERIQDAFESAPTGWSTQSGVWGIMARYACDPKWNWFGGYGAGTPMAWTKYRLDGNQSVEAYLGVKMQYDNALEEYQRRFRDLNVTICGDGIHPTRGYTVIRGGRLDGQAITLLLRNGVIVGKSTTPAHLFPPQQQGHREWFATRIEKHGMNILVFLDNRLALSYRDPQPLPGGYVGIWTVNNGMMIGRVNLAAERLRLLPPPVTTDPVDLHTPAPARSVPKVLLNGNPLMVNSFETGSEGWHVISGGTMELVSESLAKSTGAVNTYLKAKNSNPLQMLSLAHDFPQSNLNGLPILHLDYCADTALRFNIYFRRQWRWYEVLLSGDARQDGMTKTLGKAPAIADGKWHHLRLNLAKLFAPTHETTLDEMTISCVAPAKIEGYVYDFDNHALGAALRLDNIVFTRAVHGASELQWEASAGTTKRWLVDIDRNPQGVPTRDSVGMKLTVPAHTGTLFMHLSETTLSRTPGAILHIPVDDGE